MMSKILWDERSSVLLYLYFYIALIIAAIALYWYIGDIWAALPAGAFIALVLDAKTKKHELTDNSIYFSSSFLDKESTTIPLKDITGFYIVDKAPWNIFSLGTVILITDFSESMQPCIKCIRNPRKLADKIKRHALKQGAIINSNFT